MADMIQVTAGAGETIAILRMGTFETPCALGRAGILVAKREGDGGTPDGIFPLRELRYRADRIKTPPATSLPIHAMEPGDGWCDDPKNTDYNRLVRLPSPARAENMWREDHLYDLVAVIGCNDDPVVPGAGSAIFLHVANEIEGQLMPTEGCVALREGDLLRILLGCSIATQICIRLI